MSPLLLLVGVAVAWLIVAALLALAIGRTVAVARVRDEHKPPRTESGRGSLARRTTVILGHAVARSR